jgi:hypothetical protein
MMAMGVARATLTLKTDTDVRSLVAAATQERFQYPNCCGGKHWGVEVMGHARVLPRKLELNGSEEMRRLTEDCGGQMQERLEIGMVPINALAHATIPPRKTTVPCSDAFNALTEKAGDNLIYQVMADITDKMFIVSIIPNRVVLHSEPE